MDSETTNAQSKARFAKQQGWHDLTYRNDGHNKDPDQTHEVSLDGFRLQGVKNIEIVDPADDFPTVRIDLVVASVNSEKAAFRPDELLPRFAEGLTDAIREQLMPRLAAVERAVAEERHELTADHALLAAKFGWTPDVLRRMTPEEVAFYVANAPA